ncbi:hypothetical protein [Aquimarina sp. 2201CG14-23]|uniref:hypothetical protein n=1 Tax=Aquimarina mycalae TaxID=3040073 RepID=UPI002477CECE|nr:hypothetical protein [Aquimarina sp. 2201CG14-23]MDH7444392.1 hypothetical protein [Aquimarina sp. 2201CG14-23]
MELTSFYGDLLFQTNQYPLIKLHLSKIADRMLDGIKENRDFIFEEVNNYHSDYLGASIEVLKKLNFTIHDCRATIANEYGFKNWKLVEQLEDYYDQNFENAVNYLVNGDFTNLKNLIDSDPELVVKRSKYGHKATLLNYAASNGVEMWRQKAPQNLPEMTRFLISKGADPRATMNVYGGMFDTLALLESSAHPFEAGIADEMIEILKF